MMDKSKDRMYVMIASIVILAFFFFCYKQFEDYVILKFEAELFEHIGNITRKV